jgi:hypothetical protein
MWSAQLYGKASSRGVVCTGYQQTRWEVQFDGHGCMWKWSAGPFPGTTPRHRMQRDADGEPKESKASLRLEKNVQRAQKVVESAFGKASSSSIAILQRWKSGRRPMNAEVQLVAWRHVQKAMEYINLHHLTGPRCE